MFGADGEVVYVPVKPRIRRSREDDPARARFIDLLQRRFWERRLAIARSKGDQRAMLEAEARLRELDAALAH
jgi:hypothetical protein